MNDKRFKMTAYTGAAITAQYWGRMVVDIAGISNPEKMPALREHQRDRSAGVIDRTQKNTSSVICEGYFLDTADGKECKSLLDQGYPMQASIGIWVKVVEEVAAGKDAVVNGGKFTGPGFIWKKSELREVSFVSLGADANTEAQNVAASAGLTANCLEDAVYWRCKLEWLQQPQLENEFKEFATFLAYNRAVESGVYRR